MALGSEPCRNGHRCCALIGRLGIATLAIGFGHDAKAQSDSDFKGKTVTIIIAFGAGGGYDQYGRLFARHIGRHIPGNPTVVPSNMPGANGIVAANYLYNTAPKDGTALGFLYQTIAQDQVLLHIQRPVRRHQVQLDRTDHIDRRNHVHVASCSGATD